MSATSVVTGTSMTTEGNNGPGSMVREKLLAYLWYVERDICHLAVMWRWQ